MTIPTISTLPVAPARTDAPATFVTRADAFLAAMVVMQGELNTSIGAINTDIGGIAANVTAAQAAQTAAELAETNAETAVTNAQTAVTNAEAAETNAQIYAAAAQAAAGVPSLTGNAGKALLVNTGATGVEWAEIETDPTLGTLTKTFTSGESSTINLTSSVLAPVVSVTKEVPQTGTTNNNWDVNSTTENYTRLDSAPATTLDFEIVGFDISNAAYSQSFSVASQSPNPQGVTFNTDGTKMFIVEGGAVLYEYTLTTGFDLSTTSYSQDFSVFSQDSSPRDIAFNVDGTKMFLAGRAGNAIYEYALSTGYDISTLSFVDSFSISAQESEVEGLTFNTDGTKMFIVGGAGDEVNEYDLSTGFDISTATFSQNFDLSSEETQPFGISFNTDGTKMLIVGATGRDVGEYTLTTGFDVSTASFVDSFSVSSQSTNPNGIAFNANGTKMFISCSDTDNVYEYTIASNELLALGTGSFASADVGKTIEANSGAFVLTAASGSYVQVTAPTSFNQVASGSWGMFGVVYNTTDGDLELSGTTINQFDVSTAVYSQAFSVSGQEAEPADIAFNTDGSKMFVLGGIGTDVNEYTLSTGFDVSTASFVDSFSVAGQENSPSGLAFSSDGTKMFVCGTSGDDVNEYTLSTGFDVSTASFVDSFSVAAQDTQPQSISFNTDGTKMFVVGATGDAVYEYTLSTGFDVSTASFVDSFSVAAQETGPTGLSFNSSGSKMFVVGRISDNVSEYSLSTAFDVSTSVYSQNFSVAGQEFNPKGIAFNTDGTKMFIVGSTGVDVNEYSVGTAASPSGYHAVHTTASTDTTYWTDINSMTADQAAGDGNVYYCISTDDRTTWTVIDNTDGERDIVRNNAGTWQYNSNGTYASQTWVNGATNTELATLAEAMEGAEGAPINTFNISTAVYDSVSFSVASQETQATDMSFNTDGTKMFVIGTAGQDVNEYALSTAYNIATASFTTNFSVASQATSPYGLTFNTNGTKMFVINFNDSVYEYTLSTGFDVSTASYSQSLSVSAQVSLADGIEFNNDGTKMFIVGMGADSVFEYALSTGFDISTASLTSSFSLAAQDTTPSGIAFNTDGTKLFISGTQTDTIFEYTLSTGFDVSTASYSSNSFSVVNQDSQPYGMAFNANGGKMYVVGFATNYIYQYSTGTAVYINQMDKTQLDAVTDPNHIALSNDFDLSIILNMTSGTTVPSSDGVAINYDANVLNKGAVLGTDYDFDAPAGNAVRITALAGNNLKVRVV